MPRAGTTRRCCIEREICGGRWSRPSGTELLDLTGVVTILERDNPEFHALLEAGRSHDLQFEVVTGAEARRRLPQHVVRDDDVALFDPAGGYVRSERAVTAAIRLAAGMRATFLGNRTVSVVERHGDRFVVRTGEEEIVAFRVLVCSGTGAGQVCEALGTHLAVLPQVLTWFRRSTPRRIPATSCPSSFGVHGTPGSTGFRAPTAGP